MKYLKYFEAGLQHWNNRCTALIYKKASYDEKSDMYGLERSGERVFTGKNCKEKAKEWCKKEIENGSFDGVTIYKRIKSGFNEPDNLIAWWSIPNAYGLGSEYNNNYEKYASNLSRYLFGLTQAYIIFGRKHKDQYRLCNYLKTKAPKSWESIQKLLGETDAKDLDNAADMVDRGFLD